MKSRPGQADLTGMSETGDRTEVGEMEAEEDKTFVASGSGSMKPIVTPRSRNKTVKVQCGEPGCKAKPMLLQNLKTHMLLIHKKEDRSTRGQTKLDHYFGGGDVSKAGQASRSKAHMTNDGDNEKGMVEVELMISDKDSGNGVSRKRTKDTDDDDRDKDEDTFDDRDKDEDSFKRPKHSEVFVEHDAIEKLKNLFTTGSVDEDAIDEVLRGDQTFELVAFLEQKVDERMEMGNKDLLMLAIFLKYVVRKMENLPGIDQVKRCLKACGEEMMNERHSWEEVGTEEITMMKELIDQDPKMAVYISRALVNVLEKAAVEKEVEDENQNNVSLKIINKKLDQVVRKIAPKLDLTGCKTEEEVALKSIKVINSSVNVGKEMKDLEESIKKFKEVTGVPIEEVKDTNDYDAKKVLKESRSLKDIVEKVPEFEFRHEESKMRCVVCGVVFQYSCELEQDFSSKNMGTRFSSLKRNLEKHLSTTLHLSQAKTDEATQVIWGKEEGRNKAVGLRLGRLVYYLIYHGRPDEDFTRLVYLAVANGSDCGDINHSFRFVTSFLPHLAEAVKGRLTRMLGTRLVATGCLPPVNMFADKATHQRNTRQLVGVITVNPGGEDLLVPVLLGIPFCPRGDGEYLVNNVMETVTRYLFPEQVRFFI